MGFSSRESEVRESEFEITGDYCRIKILANVIFVDSGCTGGTEGSYIIYYNLC